MPAHTKSREEKNAGNIRWVQRSREKKKLEALNSNRDPESANQAAIAP